MRFSVQNTLVLASISALIACAKPVFAQNPAPAKPAGGDAVAFYTAGLEGVLVDPKDRVLLRALQLIDERVLELPRETGDDNIPAPAIKFALDLIGGPMDIRAGLLENPPAAGGPPIYAQWNFHAADQQSAEALAGRFSGMLTALAKMPPQQIKPGPNLPGMQMIETGGPAAYFGPMKLNGASAFTLALNKVSPTALTPESIVPGRGAKPVVALSVDFNRLQPLFDMMLMQQEEEGAEMARRQFQAMGLYGPNAAHITAALRYESDRATLGARFTNYTKIMQENQAMPSEMLAAKDLKRIPADATYAQISRYNLASIGAMLSQASPEEDVMAMAERATGIHPQRDLLDHLGQTMGMYASDATGGGGLLSLVAYVEVKNADGLNQTIARLTAMLNQMALQNAKGYVRLAERTINDHAIRVLTFPGIPVPLEISFAVADGYLYGAASPQSLLVAIEQGRSGKSSLADNPRFKEMGGDKIKDAIKVSFLDTPRLMRGGYGIASLAVAALNNAVRSPTDPNRGSDLLMPSLGELSDGAKAMLTITQVQGDDLVVTCQMDRSWLVNATGFIGAMGGSPGSIATVGMLTGIMVPALGKARESAKATKSMAQLKQIAMAGMTYASEFDDQVPPSAEKLVEMGYLTEELFHSPLGPVSDGDDYFLNLSVKRFSESTNPSRQILGYDRAMYAHTGTTAVLFYDGHVEMLDVDEFMELIDEPQHAGVDFKLP